MYQAQSAHQMATRLDFDILVVLGTDLTQLECGSHLTVELILLFRHTDVIFVDIGNQRRQVWIRVLAIGIEVAGKDNRKHVAKLSPISHTNLCTDQSTAGREFFQRS